MSFISNYRKMPKLLGAHAFVIMSLLQAAKLEGIGPVNVTWLSENSPEFHLWDIKTALKKLFDMKLAVHVDGGWKLNDQRDLQEGSHEG